MTLRGDDPQPVLAVEGLSVGYADDQGAITPIVWDLDLRLDRGRILGMAGESGSGKSTAATAAIGYRPPGMHVLGGCSLLGGTDLLTLGRPALETIWGSRIAYVAQQSTAALNPAIPVGRQLAQPLTVHQRLRGDALRARELELFELVEIPDAAEALKRYPFQFSGGQQQRIAIAIALACGPEAIIFDEPTTGLDVTTQARISAMLVSILRETGMAALYVSHDLALLHFVADRIIVMYAGQEAESATGEDMVRRPRHPYTRELLRAVPKIAEPRRISGIPGQPPGGVVLDGCAYAPRCRYVADACRSTPAMLAQLDDDHRVRCLRVADITGAPRPAAELPRAIPGGPLLEVRDLRCHYRNTKEPAVDGVSFSLRAGEMLGIVGESGSGKSTVLRAVVGLLAPSAGTITFRGRDLTVDGERRPRSVRHELQLVFQNPTGSLNPRHTVATILRRPLRLFRPDVPRRREDEVIAALLEEVKLPRSVMWRYPTELSGGQCQRVAIARAFAAKPSALLCDEITSALDVSVQATILQLLSELADETGTAVVFVAHDLAVIRAIASTTIVMRKGKVCEHGPTDRVFASPQHPYTRSLIAAIRQLPEAQGVC